MSRIIPKLNLNKTPQIVENNSLIMAKNIRLLKDGTIGPDTSLEEIEVGAIIDHTETVTVVDVEPTITETHDYLLSIRNPEHYAKRNSIDEYLNIDDVYYNQLSYDPTNTTIVIEDYAYVLSRNTFLNEPSEFSVNKTKVYSREFDECILLYLIHLSAFNAETTFEDLEYNNIIPCYYCIGEDADVGKTITIDEEKYVVVKPWKIKDIVTTSSSGGETHTETRVVYDPVRYIGQIVGLDNKLYFFKEATKEEFEEIGLIYPTDENDKIRIFEYDEINKLFTIIKCGWKYSGGIIDGEVTTNNTSEIILTVCEYFETENDIHIPIKHINLSNCREDDDETIYTQVPNIPFTNLKFNDYYPCVIPNGVYQFFVRYKIRDDFYTEWFPCSEELYAGYAITTKTIQGSLRYVDKHRDCPRSFKFIVEHLFNGENSTEDYTKNFTEYQIGFILSHDDSVIARSWKSFPFKNKEEIYFDYDKNVIKEIDVDEILKTNFELFNVRNITYYKNKLFLANYEETNFNPELQEYADLINVTLVDKTIQFNEKSEFILGKPLEKSLNKLPYYDKWGGEDVNNILLTDSVVNNNIIAKSIVTHDYYNGDENKNVLKIQMYWKKAKNIDASKPYYKYDVYWLRKLENNLTFYKGNDRYAKFDTFDYSEHDNPGDNNLLGDDSTYSIWYDANTHTLAKDAEFFKYRWYWRCGSINYNMPSGNGWPMFYVYPYGLRQQKEAENFWRAGIMGVISQRYPTLVLTNLTINYTGGSKTIYNENEYFTDNNTVIHGKPISYGRKFTDDDLRAYVFKQIKNEIIGIKTYGEGERGCFVIEDLHEITGISATFIELQYYSEVDSQTNNSEITNYLYVKAHCTQKTFNYDCTIKQIETNSSERKEEYKTLMPFTSYEFYIHYVKQNGINTNGYYIDTTSYNNYTNIQSSLEIIYPVFANINIPTGYVGYFISINKVKNDVARLFNVRRHDPNKEEGFLYADCLECDTMLYPLYKNIKIYKKVANGNTYDLIDESSEGEYFSSGSNTPISEFGTCGEIRWPATDDTDETISYESVSAEIYIPKTNTTGGIIVRAGIDDDNKSAVNGIIDLESCSSDGLVVPAELSRYFTLLISQYPCLAFTIVPKYQRVWDNVLQQTVSDPEGIIKDGNKIGIPKDELKGYIITLYSKETSLSNNVFANNVMYVGLNLISADSVAIVRDVFDRIHNHYITEDAQQINVLESAIAINTYLNNIIYGIDEDDVITIEIANMIMTNVVYATILENTYWIKIDNNNENNKNKRLTKITPYIISGGNYDNFNLNLPGFINVVHKLQHEINDKIYVSGTDVYNKYVGSDYISLDEIYEYIANVPSQTCYIPSNFNLNCVTLNDDITPAIRTFLLDANNEDDTEKQMIKSVNSLVCSSILILPTMYYDFTRKYFSVYDKKQKYKFDNTIRSSDTNIDETYRNIYKFRAEEYYNIPVNRGIITNLFNLANYIYVHTEHSLFKFGGTNSLSSTEGDVTLKENDVFDTGIFELFDSKNGYAGLKNKKQSLVMFDSYVFWDDYAQQIYAFGGEGKIISISDSIDKLIKSFNPTDIQFVANETNDRFFINFRNNNSNICLSYNFKANAIISVHDMDFSFGFNSRLYTYFVHIDMYDDKEVGWSIYRITDNLTIDDNIYFIAYQNCWKPSIVQINDIRHQMNEKSLYGIAEALVDIIHNTNYELVKELDYINWICSEISQYGFTDNCIAEESLNRKYAGTKLRVYSDECSTNLIPLTNSTNGNALISNEASSLSNPNSYQYPRYNCGVWSLNYFRDIRNKTDIFDYKAYRNQITGNSGNSETTNLTEYSQRQFYTQENSLIYGKYLVFRLIFDNRNFKLENVTFRASNYDKVK